MSDETPQSPPAGGETQVLPPAWLASVDCGALPFGDAPPALLAIDAEAEYIPEPLQDRIRSLALNGAETFENAAASSAISWHEAGRLLDRLAEHPAEAWICHSRALLASPEHLPALSALRRLARRAGARDQLDQILDEHIGRASDPLTHGALLSEKAALELVAEKNDAALDNLKESARANPEAVVGPLLLLGSAAGTHDDNDLVDALGALAERWSDPSGSQTMRLLLALIEERLGDPEKALERLEVQDGDRGGPPAFHWARCRLGLRCGRRTIALDAAAKLVDGVGDGAAADAFERVRYAKDVFSNDDADSAQRAVAEADDPTRDLALISALRHEDRSAEAIAGRAAADQFATSALRSAIAGSAVAAYATKDKPPAQLPDDVSGDARFLDALEGFLCIPAAASAETLGGEGSRSTASELHEALRETAPDRAVAALAELGQTASTPEDRWSLAVAEAVLKATGLDAPDEALATLREVADTPDQAPLATLIRAHDRSPRALAALARAEAEACDDETTASWSYAWAANHLAQVDRAESEELHRRALELNPVCRLSLAALESDSSDHAALAEVLASAAASTDDVDERSQNLVRAAVHQIVAGGRRAALPLYEEACSLLPDDRELWRAALRLALAYPKEVDPRFLEPPPFADSLDLVELMSLGILALSHDPVAAVRWFERTVEEHADSEIAQLALTETLLSTGRGSVVSSRLLATLREAETPVAEATIYARLADLDGRYGDDPSSALLSLQSLEERCPGHRPTLGQLAFYFNRQGRAENLVQVLGSLSRTLADDPDGIALATAAWQLSKVDDDLLRTAVGRGTSSIVELQELEALTEEAIERGSCLMAIVDQIPQSGVHLSRLADAHEDVGEHDQAIELRRRALVERPDSLLDLAGLERAQTALGDAPGIVASLKKAAAVSAVQETSLALLLEAAEALAEGCGDVPGAVRICTEILSQDPAHPGAYELARGLLEQDGDLGLLVSIIEARLPGVEAPEAKVALLLELAEARLELGLRDGAKVAFGLALELAPDDFPNRRRLAALHQEDQEWDAAILQLTECAKRIREPAEGIEVFYALGGLYLDHTDRKDLAEKSFVKVLGWDRTHFAAMEKLANVYAATGNWQRAAQALERLVALTDKTSIKVANLIALSSVLESRLQRVDAAEKVLSEARQLAPQDIAPIEALAGMYTRQQDPMALNVLLDQALASLSAAVSEQPDADELYLNILGILNMKAEDGAASLAAAALRLLGATPAPRGDLPIDAAEIRWDAGARIGAPALIDFLCPKEIPAGLRETLRVVEGPIARLAGVSAKQLGLGRDKRLDRKHPLVQHSSQLAGAFGIRPEPQYFVEAGSGLRIGAGSPAAVVVPPAVAESKDEAVIRFIVAQALMTVRHGLSLALMLPPAQLVQTAAALTKLSIPSLTVPDLDPGELDATAARIREAVPEKLLGQITPFAFDCQNALAVPDLAIAINSVGQRAGFMGAGSLTGAFQGLRVAAGQPTGPLATLPGAGRLMSFVFSKDHLELRRQMGL